MPLPNAFSRGFTLLEMLAVIVLMAVATTVVSGSLSRGLERARARDAGRELALALRAVRTEAIVGGRAATLDIDIGRQSYRRDGRAPRALPAGLHMRMTTAAALTAGSQAAIAFFPDGSSTGGNLQLDQDGHAWRIDIAWLTGVVTWRELTP